MSEAIGIAELSVRGLSIFIGHDLREVMPEKDLQV